MLSKFQSTDPILREKSSSNLMNSVHIIKEQYPDVYRAFFNKMYRDDHKFYDWRRPLSYLAFLQAAAAQDHESQLIFGKKVHLGENTLTSVQISNGSEVLGNPLIFVHKDLLLACAKTQTPDTIKVSDLPFPFEAFSFVLPKDTIFVEEGSPLEFITVVRDRLGKRSINFREQFIVHVDTEDEGFFVSTYLSRSDSSLHLRLNDIGVKDVDTLNWTERVDEDIKDLYYDECGLDTGRSMAKLAINLLLALKVRPDLLFRERMVKQLRRDKNKGLWEPNVIGASYVIQQVDPNSTLEPGSHASPRMHWRRGHFRKQPIGPRKPDCQCGHSVARHSSSADTSFCWEVDCGCSQYTPSERKYQITWIEPCLVGAAASK